MANKQQSVSLLKNIGPTIARRLSAVGIRTRNDLERVGPARVFQRVRERHPEETVSVCYYLYSLDGALRGVHWDSLGSSRKARLRREAGVD